MNDLENIIKELKQSGASAKEAEELGLLSKNISNLYRFERSQFTKTSFLLHFPGHGEGLRYSKWLILSFMAIILMLSAGSYTIVDAQNSLPGDLLYPVKRLTENIVSAVNPSFSGQMLKRRSEEIKALSAQNNSSNLQGTINDYEQTLNKNNKINLRSVEQSAQNLEEASKSASLNNKPEIEKVILQTDNKQKQLEQQYENKTMDREGHNGDFWNNGKD